jgi:hypothetical protein
MEADVERVIARNVVPPYGNCHFRIQRAQRSHIRRPEMLGRPPRVQLLEMREDIEDVGGFHRRHAGDLEAARGALHQPIALQHLQCLAHRRAAHTVLRADLEFDQPLPRPQPAGNDRLGGQTATSPDLHAQRTGVARQTGVLRAACEDQLPSRRKVRNRVGDGANHPHRHGDGSPP